MQSKILSKVCKSVHHHTIQIHQPTRCNNLSGLLLDIVYSSTCFRRPHAHPQELNNCSSSLWFNRWSMMIAVLLVVVRPVGLTTTNNTAITTLQRLNQRLLLQLLSSSGWAWGRPKHVELYITSSNKLERLLHLVGWFIWIWRAHCNFCVCFKFLFTVIFYIKIIYNITVEFLHDCW